MAAPIYRPFSEQVVYAKLAAAKRRVPSQPSLKRKQPDPSSRETPGTLIQGIESKQEFENKCPFTQSLSQMPQGPTETENMIFKTESHSPRLPSWKRRKLAKHKAEQQGRILNKKS